MASIGSLTADLRLESAAFRRDLGRATAAMNSQTAQMRRAMRGVEQQSRQLGRQFAQLRSAAGALAGALAIRQFTRFAQGAVDAADAIAKQSRQLQFASDELQRYQLAANLAGVSTQQLNSGIGQLAKRVGEARAGTGSLAEFLKRSNQELLKQVTAARSSEEAFRLVLKAIRETDSSFDKLALSAAAFGRQAGQAMVLLAEGAEAVTDEMAQLVTRSGHVLKAAEDLKDQMTLLRAAFQAGFDSAIITGFAGAVDGSVESMREARKMGEEFGRVVGASMRGLIAAAKFLANNMREITAALAAFVAFKAATIFAGISVAVWGLVKALSAATVAQNGLNFAMMRNPIGLLATAIATAVAALVLFHDRTFQVGNATVQVGKVLHATWVTLRAPIMAVVDAIVNVRRALSELASGELRGALDELLGGDRPSRVGEVINAWRNLAPDAAAAAKDLAAGVDDYTFSMDEAGTAAVALGSAIEAKTKTVHDHIEAVKSEILQTQVLINAVKRGEEAYIATRRQIDANNEAHRLGIDLKTREGNEWANLTVQAAELNDELNRHVEMMREAGRVYDATRTPLERFGSEMAKLNEMVQAGALDWDTYGRAVEQAQDRLEQATKKTKEASNAASELGFTFSSAFEDAIIGGKKLSDVLRGLEQDLLRILTRKLVTEPLSNMLTGFLGSFSIPGRQFGGPVTAGRPFLVGEAGPELFVPKRSGEIVPLADDGIAGANVVVNNHFAIQAPQGQVPRETQQQIAAKVGMEVRRTMERNL